MAKIIGYRHENQVDCYHCGAIVGYSSKEAKEHHRKDSSGETIFLTTLECPNCKKKITWDTSPYNN